MAFSAEQVLGFRMGWLVLALLSLAVEVLLRRCSYVTVAVSSCGNTVINSSGFALSYRMQDSLPFPHAPLELLVWT